MKPSYPIACNLDVFAPEQRESHIQTTRRLMEKVLSIAPQENGFQFVLPYKADILIQLSAFIVNERLCCPFLEFTLTINPGEEPIVLSLSGPEGTREFLREEFSEVFA